MAADVITAAATAVATAATVAAAAAALLLWCVVGRACVFVSCLLTSRRRRRSCPITRDVSAHNATAWWHSVGLHATRREGGALSFSYIYEFQREIAVIYEL